MFRAFNAWFSTWEWSLALLCAIIALSLSICALALALSNRGGGRGGRRKIRGPKPKGGNKVNFTNEFISFMNTLHNGQSRK